MKKIILALAAILSASYCAAAGPTINGNQINPQTAISIATFTVTGAGGMAVTNSVTASSFTATGNGFKGAGTGLTGTAASLTAGAVTTNANLTGNVTSVGNATTIAVIPSVSGAALTSLTAANISAGTLGSGVLAQSLASSVGSTTTFTAPIAYSSNVVVNSGSKITGNGTGVTTQNVPGNSFGTVYQNTGANARFIVISVFNNDVSGPRIDCFTDSANPPTTRIATVDFLPSATTDVIIPLSFFILPGNYYKCTVVAGSPVVFNWTEWQ